MSEKKVTEISIAGICAEVYRNKWFVIIFTSLFCVAAVATALMIPNQYTAKSIVAATSEEQGGLASLAKSMGGFASLAGLGLNASGGSDKSAVALEVIKSPSFINYFVNKYNLVVPLMAANASDQVTYELVYDEDIYNANTKNWTREVKPPKTVEPSPEEIYKRFSEILEIEENTQNGFINISIKFYSPLIARTWIEILISEINEKTRKSDIDEARKSLEFLNKALEQTSNANMKDTFYQLIEEQTKTLMLTNSRKEYVFKTISPAITPEKKSSPSRALICIAGTFLGGILSVLVVLMRYFYKVEFVR
jgi:uncharacterized protein involved in exopolysaccharide biosynthesis